MYEYYGIYAACRDAAWRCLLDFGVCKLPVKVLSIARRSGIHVVRNTAVGELRRGEYGVSITDGSGWTIVYDDTLSFPEARIVIAHELGHIFLGHEYRSTSRRFACGDKKLVIEKEADMFAVRLLAPAFALHELHITDAEGIAELCDIPFTVADDRSKRMKLLEARALYYISPLEIRLRDRFRLWFEESRTPDDGGL